MSNEKSSAASGFGIGHVVGAILCWCKWHSILSLIWPLIFGWGYVIYFAIKYGIN